MKNLLFLLLFVVFTLSCSHSPKAKNACPQRRAAFDVGSASIKMKVALVDICEKKLLQLVDKDTVKVDFKENVELSENQKIEAEIEQKGLDVLRVMSERAHQSGVVGMKAVATAGFRAAANGHVVAAAYSESLGFPVEVIDQSEEARIGFLAGLAMTPEKKAQALVWDIGGGSQQLSYLDEEGKVTSYLGTIASIGFRDLIISKVKKQNPKKVKTPNPIRLKNLEPSLKEARRLARAIPEEVREKISALEFVGIGGVHMSVAQQVGAVEIEREELEKVVRERVTWTDAQVSGDYADTNVTNLIFVLGFMQELGIQKIKYVDANLTDGVLVDL